MKSFDELAAKYYKQHINTLTRLTHLIGIPSVLFSLWILLSWVNLNFAGAWSINFSWLTMIALLVYYFFLNVKLGFLSTVILFVLAIIAVSIGGTTPHTYSVVLFLIFFLGGFASLFIGHFTGDKTQSNFHHDWASVMTAPLFVIVTLVDILGLDKFFDIHIVGQKPVKTKTGSATPPEHQEHTDHVHKSNDDKPSSEQ